VSLFVDTSAFYAAADESDDDNGRALAILASGEGLVTTDHVLAETWLLLRRRLGRTAAHRHWAGIRSGILRLEIVGRADLDAAWTISRQFEDRDFSLVDLTSFAVMLRLGIERVASFDHHFAVFRFGRGRKRAFEVVR
jgi:predicted nucleic acid-binding protein